MGILSTLLQPRDATYRNPPDWLYEALGGEKTVSGERISEQSALRMSAVWAAVSLIASSVASLPLIVYREAGRGKERETSHPLYRLLHDSPNPEMGSMVFRETLQAHMLTWGNAFAEIVRDGTGRPSQLWPIGPDVITIKRVAETNEIVYLVMVEGGQKPILARDMLHIPGLGFDGIVGYSVIHMARESLGLTKASEKFGSAFFGNGTKASGVLEHPNTLDQNTIKLLRKQWDEMHQGAANSNKVAILTGGMAFKQLSIPPEDAQFLETRKFQVEEVARWFNVPPHKIRSMDRATFTNIEHQNIEFVVDTIRPWLVRWEQELRRKLFNSPGTRQMFAEHLVDGLLRGDQKTRYEAYASSITNGWMSRNEVRELENLNPVDGLDEYFVPLNMGGPEDGEQEPDEVQEEGRGDERAQALLYQAAARLVRREVAAIKRASKKDGFSDWLASFYEKHAEHISQDLAVPYEYAEKRVLEDSLSVIESNESGDIENLLNEWESTKARRMIEDIQHGKA